MPFSEMVTARDRASSVALLLLWISAAAVSGFSPAPGGAAAARSAAGGSGGGVGELAYRPSSPSPPYPPGGAAVADVRAGDGAAAAGAEAPGTPRRGGGEGIGRRLRANDEATVFVGNLDYGSTAQELRRAFSAFGEVKSVSLPPNRKNGGSRGFAFVTMARPADAEGAVRGMDGATLRGRAVRASRNTGRRPDPVKRGKIYVGNLHESASRQELLAHFREHGVDARNVVVPTDRASGARLSFAFAAVPEDDVASAVEALDGSALRGRSLLVRRSTQRTHRTFFVGGLPRWTEMSDVREILGGCGTDVSFRTPGGSELCMGGVLVTVPSAEAEAVMESIRGKEVDGRALRVERYAPRRHRRGRMERRRRLDAARSRREAARSRGEADTYDPARLLQEGWPQNLLDFVDENYRVKVGAVYDSGGDDSTNDESNSLS